MGPGYVNRALVRHGHGLVIGELPVRAPRFALALERADEREWMIGAAGGPGAAAVARARQPERHVFPPISKAAEVGGVAIGTERDRRVAAEVVGAGSRNCRIVRERRDAGDESTGQRRRPGLAAVERGV